MSHVVTGIAQRRVIGSSARKAVLMFMAGCASDDGSGIWTSKANMAADLEMSKRTVQNAIAELVGMGVVYEVGSRPCKNGFTIEYGINLSALSALECTRAADAPVQKMHLTRAADAPLPVQQMHPNLPLTIHEPSLREIAREKKLDGFEEFWASVPRKIAKPAAQKAYARALRTTDAATLLTGIRRYAQERQGQDAQYTAHPATWLNAGRWADETETPKLIPITGGNHAKSERRAFDQAVNALADGLRQGTVHIDNSSRDPFAVRAR